MREINFKKDLFDDNIEEKKGRKSRFLSRYSEKRFLSHIKIPIEHTVIIAIGVLMAIIIAYAVGVERGKRNPDIEDSKVTEKNLPVVAAEIEETVDGSYPETGEEKEQSEKGDRKSEAPETEEDEVQLSTVKVQDEEEIVADIYGSAYIIQLASFKKETSAKDEIGKLKNRGIEAGLTKKGSWYQVYAMGYRTKEEAQKALQEFLHTYIDCYIRKVE